MKKVIIITLNYNQNDYTVDCINSILLSNYKNFEIIVVDNGSTLKNFKDLKNKLPNDSRLFITRCDKNIGYVGGINKGFSIASKTKPEYMLVMNNDTLIDEKAIDELVKTAIRYKNKVIVSGKVYHYDEPNKFQDIGRDYLDKNRLTFIRLGLNEIDYGQYDNEQFRDMLDDVFWLLPYKLYDKIGGYSDYFWFNSEQADYALRAKKNGYKLIYTPKAKIWHKGSVSIGGRIKNPKLAYWTIQSSLILRFLHISKLSFFKYYIMILVQVMFTYAKLIINGHNKNNRYYAYAQFAAIMYFNKWIFTRNINKGKIPKFLNF
jgi:GT2 family glycosyltransferase